MADELAFFELLASSAVFEEAMAKSKESFSSTVKEITSGSTQIQRDMLAAQVAVDKATAALAAQRAETARARYASGQIGAPALALAQARSQKASVTAAASEGELASSAGGGAALGGLGPQIGLMAALAAIGGAGAGLAALDQLVNKTGQYSVEVLRNSQAIGLNNQDMQVWLQLAAKVGIDEETLVRSIGHFNKEVADGAPTLRASGVNLKDLGITSTDTGTALLQAADYFHTHTDAVRNDQIAADLFGRSSLALLPILQQGSSAIKAYGDELRSFGIIMSDAQLATGAAEQAVHGQFMEALKGLESQLTMALEPAFIELYQTITTVTINGGSLFAALGHAVADVVGFIAGAIAGLTGVSVNFASAGQDAGAAFDGLGNSAQNASSAVDGTGGAMKATTKAIDDQIRALQDQKQAFDDSIDAQKQALQDQLDASTAVTDGQRKQGEDLVSYQRRLAQDALQAQIKTLDDQKSSGDRAYDDRLKKLEDEKAAVDTAASSMAADYAGTGAAATDMGKVVQSAFQGIDTKAFTVGQDVGAIWAGIFKDPQGTIDKEAKFLADTVGPDFGKELVKGVEQGITAQAEGPWKWLWKLITQHQGVDWSTLVPSTPNNLTPTSNALGTITTRDQLSFLHKNEAVIPLDHPTRAAQLLRQAGLTGAAGGGVVQNVTFNGPVATEYVAGQVAARMARDQARKLTRFRGGVG